MKNFVKVVIVLRTLSGSAKVFGGREGSITVLAAAASGLPDGTGYESVMNVTRGLISALWWLDPALVRVKHFPSINWNISFSNYLLANQEMTSSEEEQPALRNFLLQILRNENDFAPEISRIGKDSLSQKVQVTLFVARMIREDFLSQNIFTSYDRCCPLWKTEMMTRAILHVYHLLQRVFDLVPQKQLTWNSLKKDLDDVLYKLFCLKFVEPKDGQEKAKERFSAVEAELKRKLELLVPKLQK